MMRVVAAVALVLLCAPAKAQQNCPRTPAAGNSSTTCANTAFMQKQLGALPPVTYTGVIFAKLPSPPVAGTIAYITDGKAANCGDGTCTTWHTTVTAGGGALKFFVQYLGSNWLLF